MLNATTAVESLSWCIPKPAVRKQSLNRGDLVAQRGVSTHPYSASLSRSKQQLSTKMDGKVSWGR